MSNANANANAMDPQLPRFAREPNLSLRGAWRIFLTETPPRVLLVALCVFTVSRVALGTVYSAMAFSWWDLIALIALPLFHPFAEWLIHVFILHFRPRTFAGRTLDFPAARYHRAHHVDPWDLRFVAMPLSAMFTGGVLLGALSYLLMPTLGAAHTTMVVATALALIYEWSHFLVHTSYRPRGFIYKRIYKFHRLHHFKNERYWMGVSRHLGDYVLGTMKRAQDVESSPTAKNLLASFDARES